MDVKAIFFLWVEMERGRQGVRTGGLRTEIVKSRSTLHNRLDLCMNRWRNYGDPRVRRRELEPSEIRSLLFRDAFEQTGIPPIERGRQTNPLQHDPSLHSSK